MSAHNELGKEGEEEAVRFLQKKGYAILERNWRHGRGEIDIIASYLEMIIFIEVKTRRNYAFGYPEESVNRHKQNMLLNTAEHYLEEKKIGSECRFDILSVYKSKENKFFIRHFEDAFF